MILQGLLDLAFVMFVMFSIMILSLSAASFLINWFIPIERTARIWISLHDRWAKEVARCRKTYAAPRESRDEGKP